MLKGLRPPTHRIDAPGVYIFPNDDAWDSERIDAELEELAELALLQAKRAAVEVAARQVGVEPDDLTDDVRAKAEAVALTDGERDAARSTHAVLRYHRGESRFQLDAPDQGPRGPACAADYLRSGADATRFELRRVGFRDRARIELETDPIARWTRWVQAGVARITTGDRVEWAASGPADMLPEAWVEALADSAGSAAINLISLAGACSRYSQPITPAEGKH